MSNETTEVFGPVLDLSQKRNVENIPKDVVASPVLMPPPPTIPKCQPINKKASGKPVQISVKGSINSTNQKSSNNMQSVFTDRKVDRLMSSKTVHCSVPSKNVHCFVTNNVTDIDMYTKQFVQQQIRKKVYAQPEK